ncbi:tRNA(adenine34) deaminase [Sphingomonas endophytica]|uniref:tRNA(Adenine34) deaminase n=1 Tax=Sphingomonas endophytica TaxID=869719 RepID=A0A7X0JEB2_9SPHN|nr:tRNA(adenine34) deaminase [Sphingomonas endophytica]
MGSNHLDHAETIAFRHVFILQTTLEPCVMCWGTLRHLPISRLVYAIPIPIPMAAVRRPIWCRPRPATARGPVAVVAGVRQLEARALFRRFLKATAEPFRVRGAARGFVADVRGGYT